MTAPHDLPTATELVVAVREFLEADVLAATDGRVQFHTRVAINVLRIVERELLLGAEQATTHDVALTMLGVTSDDELAAAIREGRLDDRLGDTASAVRAMVAAKLAVANPGYLDG